MGRTTSIALAIIGLVLMAPAAVFTFIGLKVYTLELRPAWLPLAVYGAAAIGAVLAAIGIIRLPPDARGTSRSILTAIVVFLAEPLVLMPFLVWVLHEAGWLSLPVFAGICIFSALAITRKPGPLVALLLLLVGVNLFMALATGVYLYE